MTALARQIRQPLKRAILGLHSQAHDTAWNVMAEDLRGVAFRWPATLPWASGSGAFRSRR